MRGGKGRKEREGLQDGNEEFGLFNLPSFESKPKLASFHFHAPPLWSCCSLEINLNERK